MLELELATLLQGYLLLVVEVAFVAGKGQYSVSGSILPQIFDPLLSVVQTLLGGRVKDADGCCCITVVNGSD